MALIIDSACVSDLPAVLALLEQAGLPPDGLRDHVPTTLVAREANSILGSAALELYGNAALLRSVAVDETWRGRGLGHQLTRAALDLARQHGIDTVYLLTETATDFFPRFGFRRIARADVAPAVQQSVEFTSACPASAAVLALELDSSATAVLLNTTGNASDVAHV
ncbi:MAG TPA: arsenic resistance N-acetyltransferase ArsN2 [Roseiflexaceae bacterium]|nr:arsenic resistance N-acetyltransferase ArsN2 [Roseiflexaceae bacterium]